MPASQHSQQTEPARAKRLPGLLTVAWLLATAVLVLLGIAVDHHLRDSSSSGMVMGSMSDSLYRAGSGPDGPLLSANLFTAWQLDAVADAVLLLLAAGYLNGVRNARRRGTRWPAWQTASFAAGLLVCALATNSSIAVYDMSLFTAHMIGHLMLVMLAPALLMAGRPLNLLLAATDGATRRRIQRILLGRVVSLLTAPPVVLASYTVVIVGSHLTGLMDQIMQHTWAGQLEHLAYLLIGCQFFVVVIGDPPIRWKLAAPARLFMLALSMAVDTFTGVTLLQTTVAVSMNPPPTLHVNTLADTQTGGAIMWFGGDGIMAVIMVVIAVGWIHRPEWARREPAGWLEQARRANFDKHTGAVSQQSADGEPDFDDDEVRLEQYNAWLRKLNSPG
ncbi:MAG TPA: cytochrome c oxidase assembly protein [Jatrophihabitans sp.]|nr:cytochrome c oxidase assembly protein [Jatrophihabitans sp.]